MDVLSDAVAAMRTGRPHSGRRELRAPWGSRFAASEGAGFHVVLQGTAWLIPGRDSAGRGAVRLAPGDVVFIAHGGEHALASAPDAPLTDVVPGPDGSWPDWPDRPDRPHAASGERPPPGGRADTVLLCGSYQFDRSHAHPLLAKLPEIVHLPARVGAHRSLRAAVELLGMELEEPQAGSDTIVSALLDTLLLYILRAWWLRERVGDRPPTGWSAALNDPAVGAALRAVHGDPAHPWTVAELAAAGGLSRAAFARRFTALIGRPPLAYLTWWRMTVAGRLLRRDDAPLRVVAQRTGYASEFAFAKAFKREFGVAPGEYRGQRGGRRRGGDDAVDVSRAAPPRPHSASAGRAPRAARAR